jgi:hypothetical protein
MKHRTKPPEDDADEVPHVAESTARHSRGSNFRAKKRGNRFADTMQTRDTWEIFRNDGKLLILFGERGGTRTLDPMIKSHVLYRLSYALTCRISICRPGNADTTPSGKWQGRFGRFMLQTALCRGWADAGQ